MNNSIDNSWTHKQTEFLKAHSADMSFAELAKVLGKTQNAVRLKAHKMLLKLNLNQRSRQNVNNNIIYKMISNKVDPRYFRPKREWFIETGVSQKRFWGAMRGEFNLTNNELISIAHVMNVDLADFREQLQLEIEFND